MWHNNSISLLFVGSILLLYPQPKFKYKSRIGALFTFLVLYIGTYVLFLITWTNVGYLKPGGVLPRYFFPALGLLPFIFGINHNCLDTHDIDPYLILISISLIAILLIEMVAVIY